MELVEKISLLEWLANNYKKFGKYRDILKSSLQYTVRSVG